MFKYFDEFYKAALYHFIVSAICAALFALGLEYSRGEDGDDVVDYYIPSIVLSAIQCSLSIVSILLFALTRGCPAAVGTFGSKTEKHYQRLKTAHGLFTILSFAWGFVGSIMAAVSGICKKQDKCSYAVNIGINRALAIIIIVMHVLNVAVSYITISTSRSKSRTTPFVATSSKKETVMSVNETASQKSKLLQNNEIELTQHKKVSQGVEKPRLLTRRHSLEMLPRPHKKGTKDEYYDDSLLSNKINSRPRISDIPPVEPKPLPKKNKNLLFSAVGKVVFQYAAQKNKHAGDVNYQEPRVPSVSPPPYNDVTAVDADYNPYWLPPIPTDNQEMSRLPDNMYIGNAYPDTEIVAIQPSEISRR
ncbi:uncharacterized protein LOC132750413 [Ruditapes philippinarum]|uniref:uncharacterized protein LOC132750413 n=1 Tax=Ruditapes philippinarum TaxID=129788 RepID=UPI00295B5EBC|nr:uncharacterized protein LOC132750413 [Ruditapes philippinarum]